MKVWEILFFLSCLLILSNSNGQSRNLLDQSELIEIVNNYASKILISPNYSNYESIKSESGENDILAAFYKNTKDELFFCMVNSKSSKPPVILFSREKNLLEIWKEKTSAVLKKKYNNIELLSISYLGFGEIWLEYNIGETNVFINPTSLKKILSISEYDVHKELVKDFNTNLFKNNKSINNQRVRKDFKNGSLFNITSNHFIPSYEIMPDFDWHGGCTPTAAADVLGYYDVVYGYSNLIKYFYGESDFSNNKWDETVPDLTDVLIDKFGTNSEGETTDAEMGKHLSDAAYEQDSNYDWHDYGFRIGDLWNKIVEEVDGGYPSVFSVNLAGDRGWHSMPVVGYTTNPQGVFVFDTWDRGAAWYGWDDFDLRGNLAWIHPPLTHTNRSFELTKFKESCLHESPETDETTADDIMCTNQSNEITWYCDQYGTGSVSIYINTNNGVGGINNWTEIADHVPNTGTWNWQPGNNYIGETNRIRIRWWDASDNLIGEDASCSDVIVTSGSFQMLNDRASISIDWPNTVGCINSTTQWAAAVIKSTDISNTNYLRFYSDTLFNNYSAFDTVGSSVGRSIGIGLVNVGGNNGPMGPYGVKIGQSGQGRIQYLESDVLDWGVSNVTDTWLKNWDIAKLYSIYFNEDELDKLDETYIYLKNDTPGDFLLTLFDTHKRFSAFSDALLTIDDNGYGEDETLHFSNVESSDNRFLLMVWQKGSILFEGEYKVSLLHERPFNLSDLGLDKADSIKYSGLVAPVPLQDKEWAVMGLNDADGNWTVDSFFDVIYQVDAVSSKLRFPYKNLFVIRNPNGLNKNNVTQNDTIYFQMNRQGRKGNAHVEIYGLGNFPTLTDGVNSPRLWPAPRQVHMIPIYSSVPLKNLHIYAETDDTLKVFCGIAPKGEKLIHSTRMLWGTKNGMPEWMPDHKEGTVVLWTNERAENPFEFVVKTDVVTSVKIEDDIPTSFALKQNFPNPFNPSTTIQYNIPMDALSLPGRQTGEVEGQHVSLVIYDILGHEIATLINEPQKPGQYSVEWNAENYPSGIYLYELIYRKHKAVKKLTLIK